MSNLIQEKSFEFAVKIIKLTQKLQRENKEFVLSRQLIKAGTSIGANIEEAIGGQSRKDFISKISISYKEAKETLYWLRLLETTNYLSNTEYELFYSELSSIQKILGQILITTKINGGIKVSNNER